MTWKQWTQDEWRKEGDRYSYAKVWRTGLPGLEIKRRGIEPFIFSGRVGLNGMETKKYFKSKSAALAFASEWLRRN